MSVPTRTDRSRSDVDSRRDAPTPPQRPKHRLAAAGRDRATGVARLAGAAVVLAALLAAFAGWLAVLL